MDNQKPENKDGVLLTCAGCGTKYRTAEYASDKAYKCKRCGGALAINKDSDIPVEVTMAADKPENLFGKYILVSLLGRGGMGMVFKAYEKSLGRYVALKMILPDKGDDPENARKNVERFMTEAQTAAKLTHPNIVQVYEVGRHSDKYYIAMEYVEGGHNLRKYIDGKLVEKEARKLPVKFSKADIREHIEMLSDTARALDYAHKHNVIHRDVKPENILLSEQADSRGCIQIIPKIADFGLAKETASRRNITMAGSVVGTPYYMSPEQATGSKVDKRSDVFSLGTMLYELITGKLPFAGTSSLDVMKAVVNKEPGPPVMFNSAIDRELSVITLKALEKEAVMRYQSAAELAEDIKRYIDGDPILATPPSSWYRLVKRVKKNKIAFVSIAATALVLAAVSLYLVISRAGMQEKAENYLKNADAFFAEQKWEQANENYIKYLEIIKNDERAEGNKTACENEIIRAKQESLAMRKQAEEAAEKSEADRKKQEEAMKIIGTAWSKIGQASIEFYKKDTNIDKVWLDIDRVDKQLDEAEKIYPTAMSAFYKGMIDRMRLDMDEAETHFTDAVKKDPDYSIAYIMRGLTYLDKYCEIKFLPLYSDKLKQKLMQEYTDKANADFDRIADKPVAEEYRMYFELTIALKNFKRGSYAECISQLTALADKHKNEMFRLWAGKIACLSSKEEAHKYFEYVIENISPQNAEAYFWLGRSQFLGLSDNDGLIKNVTISISKNPYYPYSYMARALSKSNLRQWAPALNDLDEAIRLKPHFGFYTIKAQIEEASGDKLSAERDFSKAIDLNPASGDAYYNRAYFKINAGDIQGAIDDFTVIIDRKLDTDINLGTVYFERGAMRDNLGDCNGALSDLSRAVELGKTDDKVYFNRGFVYAELKQYANALADFNKAAEMNPKRAEIYFNRGFVMEKLLDYEGALRDFEKAVELEPGMAGEAQQAIERLKKRLGR
ncbi:MAG: protein kinase [Planctomycetes bacterium]|nr:protein kinase [Planctomycetota bacterium]